MKSLILTLFTLTICIAGYSQQQDSIVRKKGSYLYYGQPNIEDNSMFIEEAFNQEEGIIQHISNWIFSDFEGGDWTYAYTQEIPMIQDKFQFSFTMNYNVLQQAVPGHNRSGLGDLLLNFRPMLMDKSDWAIVIPRFTVILPTGNAQGGMGDGAWGTQFNMAVTKRLSSRLTTHWNAGFTKLFKKEVYTADLNGNPLLAQEKNQSGYNLGLSGIYIINDALNLMVEYVSTFDNDLQVDGSYSSSTSSIINPGFRTAFSIGKVQIVPGAGIPLYYADGKLQNTGCFIYLSIEPAY